jgi:hypothetical protein
MISGFEIRRDPSRRARRVKKPGTAVGMTELETPI